MDHADLQSRNGKQPGVTQALVHQPHVTVARRDVSRCDFLQPVHHLQRMQVTGVQDHVDPVECIEDLGPQFARGTRHVRISNQTDFHSPAE